MEPLYGNTEQPATSALTDEQINEGLKLHRLTHDKPSQLADGFRAGARWAARALLAASPATPTAQEVIERPKYDWCPECHARDSTPETDGIAAQGAQAEPLPHGHRDDFYLMANARRIAAEPIARIRAMPNWTFAARLFATGSTSANAICERAGIDPDGVKVERIAGRPTNSGGE